jgi:hypothetical protein
MTPADEAVLFALHEWRRLEKEFTLNVQGNSMLPLIKPGERVTLKLTNPHRLRRGDLFAFAMGENITVHRFVKKRKCGDVWWFCEEGDNVADWRWVPEVKVLGIVQAVQGAEQDLDMKSWPWIYMNPIVGFLISASVTLCEELDRVNSRRFWRRGAWNLHRANKKLLRKTIHEVTRRKTKRHEDQSNQEPGDRNSSPTLATKGIGSR